MNIMMTTLRMRKSIHLEARSLAQKMRMRMTMTKINLPRKNSKPSQFKKI